MRLGRVLRSRLRQNVLVTCKSHDAFQGVFYEGDNQAIVLTSASQVDPQSEQKYIPANGEIVILVADIAYIQFV